MKTPMQKLDDFEKKHGDYNTLLCAYTVAVYSACPNDKEARRLTGLIQKHRDLVMAVVGYQEGRKAQLSLLNRISKELTGMVTNRTLAEVAGIQEVRELIYQLRRDIL